MNHVRFLRAPSAGGLFLACLLTSSAALAATVTGTFQVTAELLRESGDGVAELVTHTFRLADYRQALFAAQNHGRSGAVKVRITP